MNPHDPKGRDPKRRSVAVALVAALGLGWVPAEPAIAADAVHGGQLAQQWCASCHVLPANPKQSALQGPPSFRDLARSKTPDQLRVFLLQPHGSMPPLALSRPEIDDLVAYIESLR